MLVQTPGEFAQVLEVIEAAHTIVLDTETTWTDKWYERKLLGIALYIPGDNGSDSSYYLPFRHEHDQSLFPSINLGLGCISDLGLAFKRTGLSFVFHNAKFDLQVLWRAGIHLDNKFWCTMLMSHMIDENTDHDLEFLSRLHLGEDGGKENKIHNLASACGGWEKIPPEAMAKYAERDCELTHGLFKRFHAMLEDQEMLHLWRKEAELCLVLAEMEHRGIAVDREKIKTMNKWAIEEMKELRGKLGIDPMKPTQLAGLLFKDMGLPYPTKIGKPTKQFPKGRPSMNEATLLSYGDVNEVKQVLRYRGLLKARSTWLEPFLEYANTDGRLHALFNQHGTVTTRLSSAKPNMQQIPRDETTSPIPVKKILSATTGFELWEFDYSQVELRLAAAFAQEESMLITLREGGDIHQLTANLCDTDRHGGKTLNFAMVFGAGIEEVSRLLGVSMNEGRHVLSTFHASYPKLKYAADLVQMRATDRMWIRYWNGRRRHFKEVWECRKAFNSWVQGGAAQIIFESSRRLRNEYNESSSRIVGMVHDSLWIEIPEPIVTTEVFRIKMNMSTWPADHFKVPFPVDYKRLA